VPKTNTSSITQIVVGEAIRSARLDRGLTQAQLAERLQAAPTYLSAIEAGRENLTLGSLARIAAALGTGLNVSFPAVRDDSTTLDRDLAELREQRVGAAA
jgi:transcriptional regulator with XRE-family HTH domain